MGKDYRRSQRRTMKNNMKQQENNVKALDDYIYYLNHIKVLTKTMTPYQKEELNKIFVTLCVMMSAFKIHSKMGKVSFEEVEEEAKEEL